MKFIIKVFIITILTVNYAIGQSPKFIFSVDDISFLEIRQNANGDNIVHQNNIQTSMFFGSFSGFNNVNDPMLFGSGDSNTAFGFGTLADNTTGARNTAVGTGALDENVTGWLNTAIGFSALGENISGSDNIGIGKSALRSNQIGGSNVAIGNDAFNNTNIANRSIAIGGTAGTNDSMSVDNVYIGYGAGRGTVFATDGYDRSNNTMLGSFSGYQCETEGNVFIGYRAGFDSKADNQLYITNAQTDSINSLIYGQFDNELLRINGDLNINGLYTLPNTSPTTGEYLRYNGGSNLEWASVNGSQWNEGSSGDLLYEDGDVGIGIGNPIYRLDIEDNVSTGYVARFHNTNTLPSSKGIIIQTGPITNPNSSVYYTLFLDGNGTNIGGIRGNGAGGTMYSTTSDRRLKKNIRTYTDGLALVNQIRPTTYQMKSKPGVDEIGFIAQELYPILPNMVGGTPDDDVSESPMTVDYGRLTPVIVSAIQEQQTMITQQAALIKELSERLSEQDKATEALKAEVADLKLKVY